MILLSYYKQIRQRLPATHLEDPPAPRNRSQFPRPAEIFWFPGAPALASPVSTVANRSREMAKGESLFVVSIASVILTSRQYEIKSGQPQSTELHECGDNFYRFLASFAVRSAEQIVPLLSDVIPISTIATKFG
jgi:hypothetical protein